MIAPPAVQAQSFDNAILTDMLRTLFLRHPGIEEDPILSGGL
jgi:hypothetical protein